MVTKHGSIKTNLELFGSYIIPLKQQDDDNTVKKDKKSFTTKMTTPMNNEEIESVLKIQRDNIINLLIFQQTKFK